MAKKKKKYTKASLLKDLNDIERLTPNIYAFLEERGVDYKIIDQAQEFISSSFYEATISYNTRVEEIADAIEDQIDAEWTKCVATFRKRIEKLTNV